MDIIVVSAIAGMIGLIIGVTFWNIRRSRCTEIKTPCSYCVRKTMTAEELKNYELVSAKM